MTAIKTFIVRLIVAWAKAHALPTADSFTVEPAKPASVKPRAEALI
ncbi:hypothetical protein [Asticcacaulis sp. 201]|nr:hypothetical protein [Asticcacaulis sp. 201]MDV6331788.1 hypothetical protein [Asticcacaulis sp. 201]